MKEETQKKISELADRHIADKERAIMLALPEGFIWSPEAARARMFCVKDHLGVETYYFDNKPIIRFWPIEVTTENDDAGGYTLRCKQPYEILTAPGPADDGAEKKESAP